MHSKPGIMVFSDLDGTLLDHDTYSWKAAEPALERLRAIGAGVVLATSKTAAEVAPLRAELGFADWPAIVENGGGLLEPSDNAGNGASDYCRIREILLHLPQGFVGFGDMSAADVGKATGLSIAMAGRAKQRRYSEPGFWTGSPEDFEFFCTAARQAGLVVQRGGRFWSLSFGGTKAGRMKELIRRYCPSRTIALGDAPNDVEMLECADIGIIVANSGATPLPPLPGEITGRIHRTEREGPKGWAEAVTALLDELTSNREPVRNG